MNETIISKVVAPVSCSKLLTNITMDEYVDLESMVYEYIQEAITDNILRYSHPKFHEELLDEIIDIFFEEWMENNLVISDDYEEIYDTLYVIIEDFFEIFENDYPKRSYINTQIQFCNLVSDNASQSSPCESTMLHKSAHNSLENQIHKIEKIRNSYQPKQRTQEWYEYRHQMITASGVHKLLGTNALLNSFIYEKCKPFTMHHISYFVKNSRQWGNIYEPLSIKIYEAMFHTSVEDFGCIQHPKYSFLGASPDGINTDMKSERYGRMIEVKNIFNRDITGIPKEDYWIQMQIQMETCDLSECDFIETRFIEYPNEDEFYQDQSKEWKGVILCFIQKTTTEDRQNANGGNKPFYEYLPLDVPLDKDTIDLWIINLREKWRDTHCLYSTQYWYLDEFSCVLVKRNIHWFLAALPKIDETWKIIEVEKKIGYEHRAAKKRIPSTGVYSVKMENDDNTHVIHNLSVNIESGVCLVKLDST